jgi:hypothetical protein
MISSLKCSFPSGFFGPYLKVDLIFNKKRSFLKKRIYKDYFLACMVTFQRTIAAFTSEIYRDF